MSPEDAFRRVLAARLPAGPGWTAWIDGTVAELAASVPVRGIDRGALLGVFAEFNTDPQYRQEFADRILALVRPVVGAS